MKQKRKRKAPVEMRDYVVHRSTPKPFLRVNPDRLAAKRLANAAKKAIACGRL